MRCEEPNTNPIQKTDTNQEMAGWRVDVKNRNRRKEKGLRLLVSLEQMESKGIEPSTSALRTQAKTTNPSIFARFVDEPYRFSARLSTNRVYGKLFFHGAKLSP